MTIRSPIAGRVVARYATVGEVVDPGDELFEITDISHVWVVGRVYQQHAAQVREGARATLILQSHPDRMERYALDVRSVLVLGAGERQGSCRLEMG